MGLGLAMWAIAAIWTMLTIQGGEEDRCNGVWSPRDQHVEPTETETDPFDEVKKAH